MSPDSRGKLTRLWSGWGEGGGGGGAGGEAEQERQVIASLGVELDLTEQGEERKKKEQEIFVYSLKDAVDSQREERSEEREVLT